MRELTNDEIAFLAWAYVVAGRRGPFDADDLLALQGEWEEHTGSELPDDFLNCVVEIHDAQ